ncbi:MAG: type II secretion system protein GspC [Deltaproteobacteria bacterium]|jgi:general secretion pathway protein C|nr:type II secretion system protein GspC [Deltaproteobacteria bacterium]
MKIYFNILNVFLISAAIYFAVNAFYITTASKLDHVHPVISMGKQISSPEDGTVHPISYYNTIIERNLFNTKKRTNKIEPVNIEALKQTDLNLKLWGTVTGDSGKTYAVIEEQKGKKQNLYKVGDTIQNATLKIILREKVVLNVNGKDEILELEKVASDYKSIISSKRSKGSFSQNITIKRSQIDNAVKNVNDLMKQVRIRPHFSNGKPNGLILSSIKSGSIFSEMGLKSGDIITGVNGKNIESVDDAPKFYESLKSSSNVQLQLKRRGRQKTINYHIK